MICIECGAKYGLVNTVAVGVVKFRFHNGDLTSESVDEGFYNSWNEYSNSRLGHCGCQIKGDRYKIRLVKWGIVDCPISRESLTSHKICI